MNVTTFLDPRYKELPFLNGTDRKEVIEQVEEELMAMMMYSTSEQDSQQKESKEDATTELPTNKAKKGSVTTLLGDLFSNDITTQ